MYYILCGRCAAYNNDDDNEWKLDLITVIFFASNQNDFTQSNNFFYFLVSNVYDIVYTQTRIHNILLKSYWVNKRKCFIVIRVYTYVCIDKYIIEKAYLIWEHFFRIVCVLKLRSFFYSKIYRVLLNNKLIYNFYSIVAKRKHTYVHYSILPLTYICTIYIIYRWKRLFSHLGI